MCNSVLKEIFDRYSFESWLYYIQFEYEDYFGLLMSSLSQLEAEVATEFSWGGGEKKILMQADFKGKLW